MLPPSESRIEYDSEESHSSQDEDDDDDEYTDAFDPHVPQREHSNHNSYRYSALNSFKVYAVQSEPVLLFVFTPDESTDLSPFFFVFFKQLVFDAFNNGSAGVGQPEIVLPNGRI